MKNCIYLVEQLQCDGFTANSKPVADWKPAGVWEYRPEWKQPLSYFAALVMRDILVAKGITSVRHGGSDGYYRCLMKLSAAGVQAMLIDMANKPIIGLSL